MKKIDRKYLGQTRYNREGHEMTIIEAKNTHDITVLFPEFGIVKKKKYYRDFLQGSISIKKDLIPDRVGQCKRMKNGKFCTIIEYENSGNCKVRFENGYVKRTSYTHFVNGEIGCCDKKRNLLNKTYVTKNSKEKYVITKEYDDTDEVEVKFLSNGKTFKYPRASAMRGIISSNKHLQKRKERFCEGRVLTSKNGIEYRIIKFHEDDKTIDIKSVNGYEYRVDPFSVEKRCELSKSEICAKRLKTKNNNQRAKIDSMVGMTRMATNGSKIELVGGDNVKNIIVQDEKGTIYEGIKLREFIKNKACIGSSADTYKRHSAKLIEGKTVFSTAGYKVTAIKYHSARKVDIIIEIGPGQYEERTVTAHQFQIGQCNPTCTKEVDESSLNEHAFLTVLKPYGFKKANKGSLSKLEGFGKREIDIYNEKHKLAIEYDGFFHQNEDVIIKDIKKDELLKQNGIKIIRIRAGVPKLGDGISKEIVMTDLHFCSPDMRDTLNKLVEMIYHETGIKIEVPDISDLEFQKKIIESYSKRTSRRKHIGELVFDRNGKTGTIIEYIDRQHVKVKFDNGYVTPYFDYGRKDRICCEENHLGEEGISRRNEKMIIISDKYDSKRVDVMFEDGTKVFNQYYSSFKKGCIVNPNYDLSRKYIGMEKIARNGMKATIEKVEVIRPGCRYVNGSFEDGTPFRCSLGHFNQGHIRHQ